MLAFNINNYQYKRNLIGNELLSVCMEIDISNMKSIKMVEFTDAVQIAK